MIAALELLQTLGRPRDLDPAALGEHAELPVLADAVQRERGHLLGVVHEEDEVRGVAGRAARVRHRALVDQHDRVPSQTRQVERHAVADDARADDDGLCALGKSSRHAVRPSALGFARCVEPHATRCRGAEV